MRKRLPLAIILSFAVLCAWAQGTDYNVPITSIRCSDPFILPDSTDSTYYMYSTGGGGRVMARASKDLVNWTEPFCVMTFPEGHWGGARTASWASEVHLYKGKYYLFTTSHNNADVIQTIPNRCEIPHRATQIYVSESPRGPFRDFTGNKAHTPDDWAALDGTLWVEDGIPYMIFCHEWLQTVDGTMDIVRLPDDLGIPVERPKTLFKASDAPWSKEMNEVGNRTNGLALGGNVTDGPWVFKTQTGKLGMLWSSWAGHDTYAIGVAYSESGSVMGPWIQEQEPLFGKDGGHGMLFRTFDGDLKLCMHVVDKTDERPARTPVILDVDDSGDKIVLVEEKPKVFKFDSRKTMPGKKISLKEFDDKFPTDWSKYNYLVLEMTASTAQRIYLGVNTDDGYNELRFIFYAPKGWIRTAIPLKYFSQLPDGAHDLAATYNHRRPLSYINIDHGRRSPLSGVDSLGIRMHMPVKDEEVRIRKAYLTVGDPGDKYLGTKPVSDEFGQWNLGEFEGKVHSESELLKEWEKEDAALAAFQDNVHSRYGGLLGHKGKKTGFFHVQKIRGKWWFVDPDGYLFLSIASTGITGGGNGPIVNPLKNLYAGSAPEGYIPEITSNVNQTQGRYVDYAAWNNYRRFGHDEGHSKANELVIRRMDYWGLNTFGNWCNREVISLGRKPFMVSLFGLGIGEGILGMPDVYDEGFSESVDSGVKTSVSPYVNNKMLIGYFVGNEPAWCNHEERLCELILESDADRPIRIALEKYLRENGDTEASRLEFVYKTFEKFLACVNNSLKKYDPNHLNLGIRFGSGVPRDEILALSKKYFDVYSFNNYASIPNKDDMDWISARTGLPMIIGEFHFGTTDRGLGESLVRVTSQKDRGRAFRAYAETGFSHPALIGVSWFTWVDQPLFGRRDGENYNIGLVDITNRPYEWMVEAIQETSRNCYEVHAGKKKPYNILPERMGGTFPDFWE